MISDFIQEKMNGESAVEKLVAINVSFWSRYLRNKYVVRYIDAGAPVPAKMLHGIALANRPDYSEAAVNKFEEILFSLIGDQIQQGYTRIDLRCDYDGIGMLDVASTEALGNLYDSKLSYSYKTFTSLDIVASTIRYREGHDMKSYNINNVVDSSTLFLEGDL